jgi:ABC-type transport system substrate-binding protein
MIIRISLILMALFLSACQSQQVSTPLSPLAATVTPVSIVIATLPPTAVDPGKLFPHATADLSALPKLTAYRARVTEALKLPIPILLLDRAHRI